MFHNRRASVIKMYNGILRESDQWQMQRRASTKYAFTLRVPGTLLPSGCHSVRAPAVSTKTLRQKGRLAGGGRRALEDHLYVALTAF